MSAGACRDAYMLFLCVFAPSSEDTYRALRRQSSTTHEFFKKLNEACFSHSNKTETAAGGNNPDWQVLTGTRHTLNRGKITTLVLLLVIIKAGLMFGIHRQQERFLQPLKTGKSVWWFPYQCLAAAILTSCPPRPTGICRLTPLPI